MQPRITIHILKCDPEHFSNIVHPSDMHRKHLELRRDDRGYDVGDYLFLREYNRDIGVYTGRTCLRRITCITRGDEWLQPNIAALSILDPGVCDTCARLLALGSIV